MARETMKTSALSQTLQTYAVATSAPRSETIDGKVSWYPGTVKMVTNNTSSTFDILDSYRDSIRTPGWKSKNRPLLPVANTFGFYQRRQSQSGAQVYGCYVTSVTTGPGSAGYSAGSIFTTNVFSKPFLVDETEQWVSTVKDKAVRNLLGNLKDMSFNAAQAIGERQQVIDLVTNTATRLAKSYRSLKRGNFAKAARDLGITPPKRAGRRFNRDYPLDQAKAVGNAWLEFSYGWKPLLSDVYGSMETLAKAQNKPNTIFKKVRGRSGRQNSPAVRTSQKMPSGYTGFNVLTQSSTNQLDVKVGVTFAVTSPALAQAANIGITNPLLLAWELTPLSFVADWFLPIGNYLSSLDATLGLTFLDGYVTVFRRHTATTMSAVSTVESNYRWLQDHDISEREVINVTRTRLTSFPSAPAPSFKNPMSMSHMASALSLLLQTFKR